jgi:cobalamin biosynthesis Co2+ chelatase CbiK
MTALTYNKLCSVSARLDNQDRILNSMKQGTSLSNMLEIKSPIIDSDRDYTVFVEQIKDDVFRKSVVSVAFFSQSSCLHFCALPF